MMATNGVTLREKRCWWNVNLANQTRSPKGRGILSLVFISEREH